MKKFIIALMLTLSVAAVVTARQQFAAITSVDAANGRIVYVSTSGKDRDTEFKANVARDCVIKEGYYRLGKPATTKEGMDIENGLRNPIFMKATPKDPVRVNIYTADEDDVAKNIKKGDVIKILVNPPAKKKP